MSLLQSLGAWCRGLVSRSYYWLFAGLLDPLDIYNRFKPSDWPKYDVSTGIFFYSLGCLILWTSFLTFHDLKKNTLRPNIQANIPLHIACRWIAKESVWAANYRWSDEAWPHKVHNEIMGKWVAGKFEFRGLDCGNQTNYHVTLPPAMRDGANFPAHQLSLHEPPTKIINDQMRMFEFIILDKADLYRTWPRRGLWSRLLRKSPIERIGDYPSLFRQQDQIYTASTNHLSSEINIRY